MSLRQRLSFVAVAIDAGKFKTPEDAADAMLETLASIYPPHRAELDEFVNNMHPAESALFPADLTPEPEQT